MMIVYIVHINSHKEENYFDLPYKDPDKAVNALLEDYYTDKVYCWDGPYPEEEKFQKEFDKYCALIRLETAEMFMRYRQDAKEHSYVRFKIPGYGGVYQTKVVE